MPFALSGDVSACRRNYLFGDNVAPSGERSQRYEHRRPEVPQTAPGNNSLAFTISHH